MPIDPITELADEFQVIVMDQRNTGTSFAPIAAEGGWADYASDQLAVMDELGIERFGVIGMCIGGAFILRLIEDAPERIAAAVALQPIGFDDNLHRFVEVFDDWREAIAPDHPEADDGAWSGLWDNLFGTGHTMFSVPDRSLGDVDTPILVCEGDDEYHPSAASRHLATSIRRGELVEEWRHGSSRDAAIAGIREFLRTHVAT